MSCARETMMVCVGCFLVLYLTHGSPQDWELTAHSGASNMPAFVPLAPALRDAEQLLQRNQVLSLLACPTIVMIVLTHQVYQTQALIAEINESFAAVGSAAAEKVHSRNPELIRELDNNLTKVCAWWEEEEEGLLTQQNR
eukprot:TRINITY_DN2227_c0_g1_i1.p1 TRINITY_DN2227_c0_g1~~TRINITY_DN2227_c0_g1_i1.p1  ORF type:complete len:140 (-),score=23.90 TRINITY_DN2227_c0_g1_i1:152-571(-)